MTVKTFCNQSAPAKSLSLPTEGSLPAVTVEMEVDVNTLAKLQSSFVLRFCYRSELHTSLQKMHMMSTCWNTVSLCEHAATQWLD